MGYLTEAYGKAITSKGEVYVRWKKAQDGTCNLQYEVPDGVLVIKE